MDWQNWIKVSRRLRNRVSLGVLEEDAQLDKKLETPVKSPQSPVDTLQRTRLTRSTFKKVEDASAEESPRRSARNGRWLKSTSPGERLSQQGGCDGGNSEPEDGEELSEVQRTEPLDRESEKETEQTTPRMPQPDTGAENLQQTRNSDGRWLLKVHSGKRRSPTSDSKRDTGVKCNANDDDSPVTEIEAPDAESEKTKKHQNYARRKSQRISNQLRPHSSTTHYEDICLGHNASKPEEDEDTNCRPDAAEQSEMQTSNIKGRVAEELEVKKLEQDHVEMDKEEGKEGPGPCDISASFELEPGSLSGTDACRSSTQGDGNSEEDEGMNCRRDIAEQSEMQTSNLCRTVKEELEVAKVDEDHVEMDKEAGKEGPGPCDISANFVLEPGSLSGTDACRRSTQGDSNSGAVQTEADVEGGVISEPLMVGEETGGMMRKLETDKAEMLVAFEEVEGENDQTEAIAMNLDQEVEDQEMEKSEETPKSALRLIVSNLDSSKNFGELQIAIISFFMVRKLSVTSITLKKSRKRGHVTFVSGKDVNRALKYDGQQVLGRALQLRRPQRVQKPVAIVKGRKRKLKESDRETASPSSAKKKSALKSALLARKESVTLLRKKKKKTREQAKTAEKGEESPPPKKKKRGQEIGRFAFIAFETSEAAASALSEGGVECKGKRIRLKHTCPKSNEERKILVLKNLPRPLSKKYLKSVFHNAVAIRVSQDKQSHGISQVEYRTAKEAKAALKGLREQGVPPGQAICVASMEEMKKRLECKPGRSGSICSLFVWGLSTETTVEMLKSTFKGAVNARLSQKAGSRSALVDFRTAADAARMRVEMQGVEIDGHKVKLFFANFASGMQGASRDPRVI
ncbi:hypothetical protein scyTo_0013503 [Scyliorhinus torazame]|uniref:RRM domain-containing protein n=1 Tax=Scyliorhinus torazame TaxID=75743 RepID=A0A401NY50_SCYTO|nr:hypothetical protein [Scyliorhinus torazame]